LKKKIKKEREKDDACSNDDEPNIASGSLTVRENTKQSMTDDADGKTINKRTQATLD
jgi:hypothetical protein